MIYLFMYVLAVLDTQFYIYDDNDFHIDIYISSYEESANIEETFVKIEFPWLEDPDGMQSVEFSLGESSGRDWRGTYPLTLEQWGVLIKTGIRVQSSERLTVQFASGLPGASVLSTYLALPLTEHSTDFYLASYQRRIDVYSPLFIIGTGHKSSTVTVYNALQEEIITRTIPENTVQEFLANSTITDTTGFRVVASDPVVVYSGHQCGNVPVDNGFCESFLQQMPPVRSLGSDYVAGPILGIKDDTGYSARAIFTVSGTELTVEFEPDYNKITVVDNGRVHCNTSTRAATSGTATITCDRTLEAGMFLEIRSSNSSSPVMFHCSRQCQVTLYNHGSDMFGTGSGRVLTDVFMLLTPPVGLRNNQARFSTILYKNTTFVNYITVVMDKNDKASVKLDDQMLESYNVSSVEFGDIVVCGLEIVPGVHQLSLHGEGTHGISVQVYGHNSEGYLNSYAFPAAFMDKDSMGPLPPGESVLSESAMIAILATLVTVMMLLFLGAFAGAAYVAYQRRKKQSFSPLLPS